MMMAATAPLRPTGGAPGTTTPSTSPPSARPTKAMAVEGCYGADKLLLQVDDSSWMLNLSLLPPHVLSSTSSFYPCRSDVMCTKYL
ncbi:hypothetical protein ZWY2020_035905 [Hordeum vulgare]|nr:hypothetical protein ZWY2020_035905 [Hordeum vulgare]